MNRARRYILTRMWAGTPRCAGMRILPPPPRGRARFIPGAWCRDEYPGRHQISLLAYDGGKQPGGLRMRQRRRSGLPLKRFRTGPSVSTRISALSCQHCAARPAPRMQRRHPSDLSPHGEGTPGGGSSGLCCKPARQGLQTAIAAFAGYRVDFSLRSDIIRVSNPNMCGMDDENSPAKITEHSAQTYA